MKIRCIGGGPAGLYFSILMKQLDPRHEIEILERNRADDTFGFGVVFSDATLEALAAADRPTFDAITTGFHHWDDIEIHYRGEQIVSGGHGFCGLGRAKLLGILARRAEELGVRIRWEADVGNPGDHLDCDLLLGADGVNSTVREHFAGSFRPTIDWRPNRFVWLGTSRPFPAFTFYFQRTEHGLWRVHAYQYEKNRSTFIVEATEETFTRSGLAEDDEAATLAFCQDLFVKELAGHALLANRSIWRSFPTVRNERWSHEHVVLVGDAAHTAHFSVGSGTKLAMEDAIALAKAVGGGRELAAGPGAGASAGAEEGDGGPAGPRPTGTGVRVRPDVAAALRAYEVERRPEVESLQRAAQASLQWFEDTERYMDIEPIQFGFSLLTRSLRITHEDLKVRDPAYVASVDRWYARRAAKQSGVHGPAKGADPHLPARVPPPLFTPFRLRDLLLDNRVVVSAMCQYRAKDGLVDDWHLVHLGSRAVGGAGLLFTEMTDVSKDARITHGCAGMYEPAHVPAWKRIVDFVHGCTGAKIGLQLAHAGRKGSTKLAWEGMDEPLEENGWEIVAPSPVPWLPHSPVPRAMERADMDRVRNDFVRSAEMGIEAGFDMLEIHFAHGYLLGSFLSPLTNVRTDDYGGPLGNRLRFPLEIFDAVRAVWPEERPISVRISATDWVPGGVDAAESVEIARHLKARGVDIVDVSAGQTVPHQKPVYGRQFQTPFADRIRHEVGVPTMAVGNISSYMDVNTILAAGRADLCALARAHLWDPYWIRNAAHKLGWPLPWPAPYSSLDGYNPRFE